MTLQLLHSEFPYIAPDNRNLQLQDSIFICLFKTAGLYLTNILALLISLAAVITWIVQFYVKLWNNVLIREDR